MSDLKPSEGGRNTLTYMKNLEYGARLTRGSIPTTYHFSPLFPHFMAGAYWNGKNRVWWDFCTEN